MSSLSILIPAITERINLLNSLVNKLNSQINGNDVEILSIIDNRKRKIGEKRNNLISLASKDFVFMLDDDDNIPDDFISTIFGVINNHKDIDVVTYLQSAVINGNKSTVRFRLNNKCEQFNTDGITQRPAWHCCVIRSDIAKSCTFIQDSNWGEDMQFSIQLNDVAKNEYFIDKIMHYYTYDENVSRAIN